MKNSSLKWIAIIEGILLILLGIFSLIRPGRMLVGYVFLYAFAAMVTGIVDIIAFFKTGKKSGAVPVLALITGILSIIAGITLLVYPGVGLLVFSVWFPIWFMLHCVSRITHLVTVREAISKGSFIAGIIFNILGILLGFVMIFHPVLTLVTLTYILGIYLLVAGIDCIAAAFGGEAKA